MHEESPAQQIVPIREVGGYFKTDAEGFLINPASAEKIQEEWRPVVDRVVTAYTEHYGNALHSVYIRGSVGKGEAIANISDLDSFAYVRMRKEDIDTEWARMFDARMRAEFPFARGVEIIVDPIEEATNDRLLISQSACVYGEDLNETMPKLKVGKDLLGHVYGVKRNIAQLFEWLETKEREPKVIKEKCTWLMKSFLRTGLELTITQRGLYTRDLYPSYKVFAECFPEKEKEMREVLHLALNPTADVQVLKRVCEDIGAWLVEQAGAYKKETKSL